eukprot:CAMPEP_0119314016 /NCGR_PEP_ID=MMETSP1333-20130426/31296_1 /TAXON_ID=418940 /ORGANISM="Scyphosphaera apsteinii, Strain RCC1455" /LENGTH=228 /DNA_ID=CAMNT_0007319025 /DNA_START=121 /DNA_END=804 /DNA_ORIENTATION=-
MVTHCSYDDSSQGPRSGKSGRDFLSGFKIGNALAEVVQFAEYELNTAQEMQSDGAYCSGLEAGYHNAAIGPNMPYEPYEPCEPYLPYEPYESDKLDDEDPLLPVFPPLQSSRMRGVCESTNMTKEVVADESQLNELEWAEGFGLDYDAVLKEQNKQETHYFCQVPQSTGESMEVPQVIGECTECHGWLGREAGRPPLCTNTSCPGSKVTGESINVPKAIGECTECRGW